MNCLVMTGSIEDESSSDFCMNRIFSFDNEFFLYNLVYKYKCLRDRLGSKQYTEAVIKEKLFSCLVDQDPLIK